MMFFLKGVGVFSATALNFAHLKCDGGVRGSRRGEKIGNAGRPAIHLDRFLR